MQAHNWRWRKLATAGCMGGFGADPERGLAGGSSTDGQLKALPIPEFTAPLIVPKVVRTRAVREEIDRIHAVRHQAGRRRSGLYASQIEHFRFVQTPITLADRGEGNGPTCGDSPESLGIMLSTKAAGIVPTTQRVDLNGQADPLAKDKGEAGEASEDRRAVVSGTAAAKDWRFVIRGVNAAAKDLPDFNVFMSDLDGPFWDENSPISSRKCTASLQDAVELSAPASADAAIQHGHLVRPALFNIRAAEWAQQHIDSVYCRMAPPRRTAPAR